jgi:hypothetical protein
MAQEQKVTPETAFTCCGGPAPAGAEACCVQDANAKTAGESGCGCSAPPSANDTEAPAASACCG